jgi:GT2 family glycosyltransferase
MTISLVIVNWNVSPDLQRCLQSVFRSTVSERLEVIVVDNSSADNSLEMLRTDYPSVQLIANAENRGFAAATNQGMRAEIGRAHV